jgi:NitT/TauT family transport system substrate-binding protein
MLDYVHPWPNAAGFYVARHRGWYRDAGLDVELVTHDLVRGDTLAYLARHEVDFGVFPSNRLLARRERGEPLIGVAAVNQTGLETIQARRDAGIGRPRDLEGKQIAYGLTPRGRAMVSHVVAHDGGDPAKVISVESGSTELTPEYLISSGFDALFGGYWCWDVLSATAPKKDITTWRMDEIGAPAYHSYLLGTREDLIENDGEVVRSFVQATGRGFEAAAEDKSGTAALLLSELPYLPAWRIERSLDLVAESWFYEGRFGVQRVEELIAPYAEFLASHGVIGDAQMWKAATTNEFLDLG